MTFQEYIAECSKRIDKSLSVEDVIDMCALGIAGEAGEVVDNVKHCLYHGKVLSYLDVCLELGDLLFYMAGLASQVNLTLEQVAVANTIKLGIRYPDGFKSGQSVSTKEEESRAVKAYLMCCDNKEADNE